MYFSIMFCDLKSQMNKVSRSLLQNRDRARDVGAIDWNALRHLRAAATYNSLTTRACH